VQLTDLQIDTCTSLEDISFLGHLTCLKKLKMDGNFRVVDISGLKNCVQLETLEIDCCSRIFDISFLEMCESLRVLVLRGTSVRCVSCLRSLPRLAYVYLADNHPDLLNIRGPWELMKEHLSTVLSPDQF
jgi:hypothetical protein